MVVRASRNRFRIDAVTTRQRARQMLDRLRWYYDIGQRLEAKLRENSGESLNSFGESAGHGLSKSGMFKARHFARAYNKRDFETLCKMRNPRGLPLGWAHVVELVGIPNASMRSELQQQAADEGWSRAELAAAIQVRSRNRRLGSGRRVQRPRSAEEGLRRLARSSESWSRTIAALVDAVDGESVRNSKAARSELDGAIAALEQIAAEAARGIQQLGALKRRRSRRSC